MLFVALLVVPACGSSKAYDGDKGGASSEKPSTPPPPANVVKTIDALGIQLEAPGDVEISDVNGNYMVSSSVCTAMVSAVGDMSESYERTIESIKKGMVGGELKEITKDEKTDTGFTIHHTTKDMFDATKDKYGVTMRVTAGAKQIDCSRVSETREQAACVAAVCASIKAI
jgi:hypothetical protein